MEVRVDGWSVGSRFSVSHFIPQHDKCGRLHGHTYAVSCVFRGSISSEDDMVLDFINVKRALRDLCEELDHLVLVPTQNRYSTIIEEGENIRVETPGKYYSFPRSDVKLLPIEASTVERLAEWFIDEFLGRIELPGTISSVEIGIEEGQGQGAWASRQLG